MECNIHICKKPGAADDNDENDEVDGLELVSTPGRVTSHVKSTNRLCCALTRGRSGVVFFGQLSVVVGKVKVLVARYHSIVIVIVIIYAVNSSKN